MLLNIVLALSVMLGGPTEEGLDSRLVARLGEKKVAELHQYRRDAYEWYVFEMDNSWHVVQASDVSGVTVLDATEVLDSEGNPFMQGMLEVPAQFDLISFDFQRDLNARTYYDLGGGKLLELYSKMEVKNAFMQTGLQNAK